MQEAEEKTTDVFYRFRKRDILKENGLRQLELVVCRGRAVHKPAPKRNKTVDALLDPYLISLNSVRARAGAERMKRLRNALSLHCSCNTIRR